MTRAARSTAAKSPATSAAASADLALTSEDGGGEDDAFCRLHSVYYAQVLSLSPFCRSSNSAIQHVRNFQLGAMFLSGQLLAGAPSAAQAGATFLSWLPLTRSPSAARAGAALLSGQPLLGAPSAAQVSATFVSGRPLLGAQLAARVGPTFLASTSTGRRCNERR